MMRLQEGITVNDKFQNSIHLSLDLNHMDKVEAYIPTQSSLDILERYIDHVLGKKQEYSTILIGPYGKGKSHLLLVLLTLLRGSKECEKTVKQLLERIRKGKRQLAEKIERIRKEQKRFLPVLLTYVPDDLNQGFLLALHEALLREGFENLVPNTYYSEAIAVIHGWIAHYPSTYQKLEQILIEQGGDAKKLIQKLSQYDKNSYEQFLQIYPQLTSGGTFQPMINMSALSIYQSINELLCSEYGYSGMFLIFDEFSKYIEHHQPETISGNMKVLQEMCELANNSDTTQIHLTFVAHKSIKEYGTFLPAAVLNSFTGVEGRMTEIFFLTSMKNNYELISYAIKKKETLYAVYWKERQEEEAFITEYFNTAEFSSVFIKEEFQKIVVKGCFPLTPLAAYFLLSISEKVAQNERTLFTFLSKEEPYSLLWTVRNRKKEDDWLIGVAEIYDYFSSIFRKDTSQVWIHREWLKADFALNQTKEAAEQKIIKTLALVQMLHIPEDICGTDRILRLGSCLSQERYQTVIEQLLQKQILCFRIKTAAYDFKQNIGVDLEEEIRKVEQSHFTEISTVTALQKYAGFDYEIPKQYNQKYAMTRFFHYQFIQEKDFFALTKTSYLFDEVFADGKILLLVPKEYPDTDIEVQKERIKKTLNEWGDERVVVIQPQRIWKEKALLRRIAAIEYLLQREDFLEQNPIIKEELFLSQEDSFFEFHRIFDKMYRLGHGNAILYIRKRDDTNKKTNESLRQKEQVEYESLEKVTPIAFNRMLSRILEQYYHNTPLINQELVNRNHISPPIRKARNTIVKKLLKQEDCHTLTSGTSPEATIFRATLWYTGLLGKQPRSDTIFSVIEKIKTFIKEAEKRSCCFSELYEILQGKAIGMRRGVIPIYLAYCFAQFQGMIVISRKGKELELSMETLDQINEHPSGYNLCTEEGTSDKTDYQKNLEELFQDFIRITYAEKDMNRRITEGISRWMRSLPQYTLTVQKGIAGMEEWEFQKLCKFRQIFQKQEVNPWEVLFVKMPEICEGVEKQYREVFEKIAFWKRILDGHLSQVKKDAANKIKELFLWNETADLAQEFQRWYQKQGKKAEQKLYSTTTNHFFNYIRNLSTHEEDEIVSKISKIIMDLWIEDWNDESLAYLLNILQQIKQEVESHQTVQETEQEVCKVFLEDSSGTVIEKYYTQKEEETNAYLFRNALLDLMEEVGESVELEQKVAILAEVLKDLIVQE